MDHYVTGSTKLIGLLGSNISYSLSPIIHNVSARELGIDNIYIPLDGKIADLSAFLNQMVLFGAIGFNVTTPYKGLFAEQLGGTHYSAINTIYKNGESDKTWQCHSTDGEGLDIALCKQNIHLKDSEHLAFIGAGQAVVSILEYLDYSSGLQPWATFLVRNPSKIAPRLEKYCKQLLPLNLESLKTWVDTSNERSILVQASPAPHNGINLASLNPALTNYRGAVVDLCYKPASALVDQARLLGLKYSDGLGMLVEQAILSQKLWWKGKHGNRQTIGAAISAMGS